MSLTFGFYNSQNKDRRYNANQMSSLFDGIIKDGIFESIGDKLMVTAGSGMTINVGTGRAWFNQTWTYNDSDMLINVDASELVLNRIDTIVIDVDKLARTNSIILIKGTPASEPTAPTLINDADAQHYQYPLCDIYVGVGVTEITQDKITNRVGVDSPFVTGAVQSVSVDELVAQWDAEFHNWMDALQGALGDEPAASLAGEILRLDEAIEDNKKYVDGKVTKCEMIWKNAAQSSEFPAQHITFSKSIAYGEVYDALYIRCRIGTVNGYEQTVFLTGSLGGICSFPPSIFWGNTITGTVARPFIWKETSIQVGDCTNHLESSNAFITDNTFVIPIAVYGIKWGNFVKTI